MVGGSLATVCSYGMWPIATQIFIDLQYVLILLFIVYMTETRPFAIGAVELNPPEADSYSQQI